MIYRTDYHIHTTYGDGKSAPEGYIAPAIAAGLKEIGFSEHLALFNDKEEWVMNSKKVEKYLNHLINLRDSCNEIKIKIGLEVDFYPGEEKELGNFLSSLDNVDYLIGAVHYMGDSTVDIDPGFYKGKNFDRLFEVYFEMVMEAVSSELFDIIAHCDLIRMFGHKPVSNPEPLYRKLAKAMKKHNVAF
jgi:histidinol-phosphatase (PHP family)